MEDYF